MVLRKLYSLSFKHWYCFAALIWPGFLQRLASGRGKSGTACQGWSSYKFWPRMQPKSIQKCYNSYGVEKILQFYPSSICSVFQHWSDQDCSKDWPEDRVSRGQPAKSDTQTRCGQKRLSICSRTPDLTKLRDIFSKKIVSHHYQLVYTVQSRMAPKAGQGTW